jgi:hypothetical protein
VKPILQVAPEPGVGEAEADEAGGTLGIAALEGLDAVPWAELTHAYGEATDVPGLLRAIAAGEDRADELFGNIWHQGTVYPATGPAVPFLVELATHAEPSVRHMLLALLAYIARGVGYYQVHGGLAFAPPAEEVAEHVREELVHVGSAHAAVCGVFDRVAAMLTHPEADTRRLAAKVLGASVGVGARGARALAEALPAEPDPGVRAAMLDGLGEIALSSPERNAWRLDPARWTAPLDAEGRALALARLEEAAHRAPAAQERVVAADVLGALGCPADRDVAALAADAVAAEEELGDRAVFAWSAELRVAVLRARTAVPDVPRAVWFDLSDLCSARSSRASGVALLVELLSHPTEAVRSQAASQLRHVGTAAKPHGPALVAASGEDPLLRALLVRPLRIVDAAGSEALLAEVLRTGDPRALHHALDSVREGDPPAWIEVLEGRLAAIDRHAKELGGAGTDPLYGTWSRTGGTYTSTNGPNLASRLEAALVRLRGGAPAPEPPLREPDPRRANPGWERVRALAAAWRARGDLEEVAELLVEEIVPQPSGLAALDLLHELGPARVPSARPVLEARLAEEEPLAYGTVEEDERFLDLLRRAL